MPTVHHEMRHVTSESRPSGDVKKINAEVSGAATTGPSKDGKVEEDNDNDGELLDFLWPISWDEVAYLFTRVLVQWIDQVITLEDRAFIRRIKRGPVKLANMLIYHKALSSEFLFQQEQGLSY